MELSEYTIEYLGNFIAGDIEGFPYRSGPSLVSFFNQFGACDTYSRSFPTRRIYAQDKVSDLNGSPVLRNVILKALDPREFTRYELGAEGAALKLNECLKFDGYEVVKDGLSFRVHELNSGRAKLEARVEAPDELTQLNIDENIRKCEEKFSKADYSGVITNSRSLVEAVLIAIEKDLDSAAPDYDGDLIKLYKRVQKLLNLDPGRKDIADSLKQVLSGLTSVVNGLASARNKMGDAHATSYRPGRHHAKLVMNSAVTLVDFLFDTKVYQQK